MDPQGWKLSSMNVGYVRTICGYLSPILSGQHLGCLPSLPSGYRWIPFSWGFPGFLADGTFFFFYQFYRTLSILYILTPLREIESTYWIVFLLLAVSFVPGLVIGKTVDGRYIKVAREEA
ncbi:uncharacterized protein O3Q21_011611 isoform 1-T4 [Podargus strigoides]